MKKHITTTSILIALAAPTLTGCNNPKAANEANFAAAINMQLAGKPVCSNIRVETNSYGNKAPEAKYEERDIPDQIIISEANPDLLKAYQTLAKAGVFKSAPSTIHFEALPYFGRPHALDFPATTFTLNRTETTPKEMTATNLCFATREVDKINQFTEPGQSQWAGGVTVTEVSYTYKFNNVAAWSSDTAVNKVWTSIAGTLNAPDKTTKMVLGLTNKGWSASL